VIRRFDATRYDQLLARYFGARGDAGRRRAFEAFKCASLLRETLWAAVSAITPTFGYPTETLRRRWLKARQDTAARPGLSFVGRLC
jgi:hypothetical protein